MQSRSPSFYLVPLEQLSALQTLRKMSMPPSYDEFLAEISRLTSEVSTQAPGVG